MDETRIERVARGQPQGRARLHARRLHPAALRRRDESQISIRGSGLRNNFHLRGINVLIDGFPYGNADGFSDFESLELLTTKRIEVYKGASALRFGGNTLGGAINLVTKTGYDAGLLELRSEAGSFGFLKNYIGTGQVYGPLDLYVGLTDTELDGYRDTATDPPPRLRDLRLRSRRRHHAAPRPRLHPQRGEPAGRADPRGDRQQSPAAPTRRPSRHAGRAQLRLHPRRLDRPHAARREPDARVVDPAQLPGPRPSAVRSPSSTTRRTTGAPSSARSLAAPLLRPRQSRSPGAAVLRHAPERRPVPEPQRRPRSQDQGPDQHRQQRTRIYAENQFDVTPTFTAVAGGRGQYAVRSATTASAPTATVRLGRLPVALAEARVRVDGRRPPSRSTATPAAPTSRR